MLAFYLNVFAYFLSSFSFPCRFFHRIAKTYDEFMVNLFAEQQHRMPPIPDINRSTQNSSVGSNGRKRKTTDDSDDTASNGSGRNETFIVKRARMNATNTVAANAGAATTAVSNVAPVTDDDNLQQNQHHLYNCMTDDNSGNEQTERAKQPNGQVSIEPDEAFNHGYVVVIPSMIACIQCIYFIVMFIFILNFN